MSQEGPIMAVIIGEEGEVSKCSYKGVEAATKMAQRKPTITEIVIRKLFNFSIIQLHSGRVTVS